MSRFAGIAVLAVAACVAGCSGTADDGERSSGAGPTGMRFLNGSDTDGFDHVTEPRALTFPADHGPHPSFRTEWWYTTGNIRADSGREFGFELTFFRFGIAPPTGESATGVSAWMANFALTDPDADRFTAVERLARDDPDLAFATASPLAIRVEDWTLDQTGRTSARLRASDGAYAIDLTVEGLDRLVYQGVEGYDSKGPEAGNASYYYSAPRLSVAGRVHTPEAGPVAVSGTAWLDHEWSSSSLGGDVVGWDWFAIQLDDGRDIMFYRLRERSGEASAFSGGTIRDPAGTVRRLTNRDVAANPVAVWTSPTTGIEYPISWSLQIPTEAIDLEIRPLLEDQEVALSVRYWEGAIRVLDRDDRDAPAGRGYLELAGYE